MTETEQEDLVLALAELRSRFPEITGTDEEFLQTLEEGPFGLAERQAAVLPTVGLKRLLKVARGRT